MIKLLSLIVSSVFFIGSPTNYTVNRSDILVEVLAINSFRTNNFDKYNYYVSGISPIKQPKSMDCWATALTMLYSWKHKQSIKIEDVLKKYGNEYLILFQTNAGIMPTDEKALYKKAGLKVIQGLNPTIDYWYDLLKKQGPLSITVDADTSTQQMIHALVITGLKGDGSPKNTIVKFIDPGDGKEYSLSFENFLKLYEGSANWPLQIIYWP